MGRGLGHPYKKGHPPLDPGEGLPKKILSLAGIELLSLPSVGAGEPEALDVRENTVQEPVETRLVDVTALTERRDEIEDESPG